MSNEHNCRHTTSFLKWFCAINYYGYYECDSCHEKIYITKEERRRYHKRYMLCVLVLAAFSVASIELKKPFLLLLGVLIHAVIYFLYLYSVSPANRKKAEKDESS